MSGFHTTLGPSVSGPALSTPLTWSVDFHATPIGPVIHGWGRGRLVARSTIARRQQNSQTYGHHYHRHHHFLLKLCHIIHRRQYSEPDRLMRALTIAFLLHLISIDSNAIFKTKRHNAASSIQHNTIQYNTIQYNKHRQ